MSIHTDMHLDPDKTGISLEELSLIQLSEPLTTRKKMTKLIKHFKYKKMFVGISKFKSEYTFFVIDKNVTWHAEVYFSEEEACESAAKDYVHRMLSLDKKQRF